MNSSRGGYPPETLDRFFQQVLKVFTRELNVFPGYNVVAPFPKRACSKTLRFFYAVSWLVVAFLWLANPVASHLVARAEVATNAHQL